jgi:hypothetical protein
MSGAALTDSDSVKQLLQHLGPSSKPPPRTPARGAATQDSWCTGLCRWRRPEHALRETGPESRGRNLFLWTCKI